MSVHNVNPALWKLLVMSLTVVLAEFFTAPTRLLSQTVFVFFGWFLGLFSTQVVPLFFRTFQIVGMLYSLWPCLCNAFCLFLTTNADFTVKT